MRSPAFTALDADGDGVVSASEIANATSALKVLDKNGDGKLTEDEVRPTFAGRGGRGEGRGEGRGGRGEPGETAAPSADEMVKTWMAFDKNADGKLSKDEVPERMQGVFDRADANKDGFLTADEIRKTAQAQTAPGGGRGEGRGEGRGGRGEGMSFLRLDPILAALNTDGDDVISAEELTNAPASLKKLDKNGDGKLTEDEVRINMPGRGGRGRGGPEQN
jgi:Ca2+-binding EF-hand superfamily protein